MRLSGAMIQVLRDASLRPDKCVCPIRHDLRRAEKTILKALTWRELIEWDLGVVPRLSAQGRAAVIATESVTVPLSASEARARLISEEHGRLSREGQSRSAKWQAYLERMKVQKEATRLAVAAREEERNLRKAFGNKGRGLSAWESICAETRQ